MKAEGRVTRSQKVGWGILLVVTGLLALNGIVWFFIGPASSVRYLEQVIGTPMQDLIQKYPYIALHMGHNAQQAAIWSLALGVMGFMVALQGWRHESRWAWNATWVVVVAVAAIGISYFFGEPLGFDNVGLLLFGGVALVGQFLVWKGGSSV